MSAVASVQADVKVGYEPGREATRPIADINANAAINLAAERTKIIADAFARLPKNTPSDAGILMNEVGFLPTIYEEKPLELSEMALEKMMQKVDQKLPAEIIDKIGSMRYGANRLSDPNMTHEQRYDLMLKLLPLIMAVPDDVNLSSMIDGHLPAYNNNVIAFYDLIDNTFFHYDVIHMRDAPQDYCGSLFGFENIDGAKIGRFYSKDLKKFLFFDATGVVNLKFGDFVFIMLNSLDKPKFIYANPSSSAYLKLLTNEQIEFCLTHVVNNKKEYFTHEELKQFQQLPRFVKECIEANFFDKIPLPHDKITLDKCARRLDSIQSFTEYRRNIPFVLGSLLAQLGVERTQMLKLHNKIRWARSAKEFEQAFSALKMLIHKKIKENSE